MKSKEGVQNAWIITSDLHAYELFLPATTYMYDLKTTVCMYMYALYMHTVVLRSYMYVVAGKNNS